MAKRYVTENPKHLFVFIVYVILVGCMLISAVPLRGDDDDWDEHDVPYLNNSKSAATTVKRQPTVKHSPISHDTENEDPLHGVTIPALHIRDQDVKEVQSAIIGGVSMVQDSLINFLSGIFDSFKKVVEKSSGKVVSAISDSINRTNSMNADYISTGKEIVNVFSDTFRKGAANLTRDFSGIMPGGRGPRFDDQ